MCRTRSAASPRGIPAAVTNNGRAEVPRRTGTAWVAGDDDRAVLEVQHLAQPGDVIG
jgi:hypothetical protein